MAARKNQSAVSDEEIIAALLNSGSIQQAAGLAHIAPRTLYDRMNDNGFKAAYNAAKSDIIRAAVLTLNKSIAEAINTITAIMTDEKQNAGARLQAARMILDAATKFADRLEDADAKIEQYGYIDPYYSGTP